MCPLLSIVYSQSGEFVTLALSMSLHKNVVRSLIVKNARYLPKLNVLMLLISIALRQLQPSLSIQFLQTPLAGLQNLLNISRTQ